MDKYFEAEFDKVQADIALLNQMQPGSDVLAPICGGVALLKGKSTNLVLVKLGSDVYAKVRTATDAIDVLERTQARLKLSWLESLEKEDDKAGLKRFEEKFKQKPSEDVEAPMEVHVFDKLLSNEKPITKRKT